MVEIIIPNIRVENGSSPLIFLAGPIRSAPQWHSAAIRIINSLKQDSIIVSPSRTIDCDLEKYLVRTGSVFPRQRAFERHYLEIASRKGAIMFWLPGEVNHKCEKSYGAMTRIELGQWMTRYSFDKSIKLAIGTDGNFSEIDTILYDLSVDAPNIPIFRTLENTCKYAVNLTKT